MKIKAGTVFTLFLFLLVMMFIVISVGYPLRAAVGPLAAGIPAAVLLITQIVLDLRRKTDTEEGPIETDVNRGGNRKHINAITWIAGLLAATYFLGILLTFTLFTMAYIRVHGWGWYLSVGLGVGIFVLIFSIFGSLLQVPLYRGILFQ